MDSDDISSGVENFSWIGRFEVVEDGMSQWFLDGAHSTLSLKPAAECLQRTPMARMREKRDGMTLVECLVHALSEHNTRPDHVIFTTYQEREDGSTRIGK
ncbi:hypothetical protein AJ80_01108 [Polytolypa hystricis UAMH7299]|uniref:Uncharacterized protein n=1 Tax=Polytolypa hystricis (strain UAMH7299) TaxID=1447883 RepID=A0A2B7Z248_POLH7|nr:hypothetical protein AJ80_01108 [Polytolypa hystricis UAMH7299]